ncbi:MAG TPA: hypothetical protein VLX68_11080 [Chitinivibrionales bacterium]|nr:hypothetical protein [Chitinivibrionales bacterium]
MVLKRYLFSNLCCLFLILHSLSFGKEESGLIFTGVDTLIDDAQHNGMDFVLERPCTSATSDNGCVRHFGLDYMGAYNAYTAGVPGGLAADLGKLNLDSIKTAPPDSLMKYDLGLGLAYMFFKIAPDSLSKCIGNVYLLKTATDPRPVWNRPFYAKIKILKFIVVDSSQHQIQMVFLWAYNNSGTTDLHTSGLDTFHLGGTTLSQPVSGRKQSTIGASPMVFKVATGKFSVPAYLQGKNAVIAVYDLAGKMLGRVSAANQKVMDLRKFSISNGVVVVRAIK